MQQRSTDLMSRPTSIAPIVFPFFAGRDARADGFTRRIAIDVDRVSILRRYMGIAMRVRVPVAAYRGVSLTEAATAPGRFDVNLVHADPDLTVTLCETANRGEAVAESRSWANLLTLPILGGEAAIEVAWSATPRSCNADATALRRPSAAARPKFLARRRVGTRERMCVVHRGEREMIAAD